MEENFNGIKIEIYRSNRKTISIELKADRLIVRAPHRMSDQEVHAFVHKKKAWIVKHQQQMLERQEIIRQQGRYTLEELSELAEKALVVIPEKVKPTTRSLMWVEPLKLQSSDSTKRHLLWNAGRSRTTAAAMDPLCASSPSRCISSGSTETPTWTIALRSSSTIPPSVPMPIFAVRWPAVSTAV